MNRSIRTIGVLLVTASAAAAQPAPTVSLEDIRPIRIGSIDGPPETSFASIAAAFRLADGRIAVLDRGAHEVRFFDAAGRHRATVGRAGEGPGEFRDVTWLGACPDGTLLAVDPGLGRVAHLSTTDGALLRHVALPEGIGYNTFLSCDDNGRALVLIDRQGRAGAPGTIERAPAAVVRIAPGSARQDTLVRLDGTEYYYASRVPGYAPLPLGARALAAAGGGWLFAAQNDGEEVVALEVATGRRTAFRHGLPQPPPTDAARRAAAADFVARQPHERARQMLERVLAEAPAPRQHPRIMDMKADSDGRAWLLLPFAGRTAVWQVYESGGRHIVSVRMPANVDPLDIAGTHIVAVERDQLGVESVLVYTLPVDFLRGTPAGR